MSMDQVPASRAKPIREPHACFCATPSDHKRRQNYLYGRTLGVLVEVGEERRRQDIKFPEQSLSNGTGETRVNLAAVYREMLDAARGQNDYSAKYGGPQLATWESVLREEFCEAMLESDPAKLREELIQNAAVSVRWVEDIDRKGSV
jgi:hypothetical protein